MQLLNSFPVFENSQVLTANQLNEVRNYLDQQNRITRLALIGQGIVCGLEVKKGEESYHVSAGIGISSWGYLFCMEDCPNLTHFKPYSLPNETSYSPFDDVAEGVIFELTTADDELAADKLPVTELPNFNEYVVVLYLEEYNNNLTSCLGKSCDELGIESTFTIRKLLITKSDLDNHVHKEDGVKINQGGYLFDGLFSLKKVDLIRPIINQNVAQNYSQLVYEYSLPAYVAGSEIAKQLPQLHAEINSLLPQPLQSYPTINSLENWDGFMQEQMGMYLQNGTFGFQYLYDFVEDLVKAFNELLCAAFELNHRCKPNSNAYPMHLMLGTMQCKPDLYRQDFVYSPLINEQKAWAKKVTQLFARIVEIANNYITETVKISDEQGIKTTPSKEKWQKLGDRAIPIYLGDKGVEYNWKAQVCEPCYLGNDAMGYHNQDKSEDQSFPVSPIKTPLYYDLNPYSFLRSEGHLGWQIDEAEAFYNQLIEKHQLPFKVKTAYVGNIDELNQSTACCYPDLDAKYLPWRNKFLYFVRNILRWTKKAEETIDNLVTAAYSAQDESKNKSKANASKTETAARAHMLTHDHAIKDLEESSGNDVLAKTLFSIASFNEHLNLNPKQTPKAVVKDQKNEKVAAADNKLFLLKKLNLSEKEINKEVVSRKVNYNTRDIISIYKARGRGSNEPKLTTPQVRKILKEEEQRKIKEKELLEAQAAIAEAATAKEIDNSKSKAKYAEDENFKKLIAWIGDFNNCLEGYEGVLPLRFCDYDHNAFTQQYQCSLKQWITLLDLAKDLINSSGDADSVNVLVAATIGYRVIEIFKEFIYIDIDTIAEMKAKRDAASTQTLSLSEIIKNNAGIEHMAGTFRDDTLLLVAHTGKEDDIKKAQAKKAFKLTDEQKESAHTENFASFNELIKQIESTTEFENLENRVIADFTLKSNSCCDCNIDDIVYDELAPPAFPHAKAIRLKNNGETEKQEVTFDIINNFYHPKRYGLEVTQSSAQSNSNFSTVTLGQTKYIPIDGFNKSTILYEIDTQKFLSVPSNRNNLIVKDIVDYQVIDKLNNNAVMESGQIHVYIYQKLALPNNDDQNNDTPTNDQKVTLSGNVLAPNQEIATFYNIKITNQSKVTVVEQNINSDTGNFSFQLDPGTYMIDISDLKQNTASRTRTLVANTNIVNIQLLAPR